MVTGSSMFGEHSSRRAEHIETDGFSRRQFLRFSVGLILGAPVTAQGLESLLEEWADRLSPERSRSTRGESLPCRRNARPDDKPFDGGRLYLTFDDGPLPCTSRILDLLAESGHKATFFVLGRNLNDAKLRPLAVRALREGHSIGNHSYDHPNFGAISSQRAVREITSTSALIREVVEEAGVNPRGQNRFFRFPYGVAGSQSNYLSSQEILAELNYQIAWWDLDTLDWRMELPWFPRRPESVLASLSRARPNDIVLLHDRLKTAQYLSAMLRRLDDHKLTSISLSELGMESQVILGPDHLEPPSAHISRQSDQDEEALAQELLKSLLPKPRSAAEPGAPVPYHSAGGEADLW